MKRGDLYINTGGVWDAEQYQQNGWVMIKRLDPLIFMDTFNTVHLGKAFIFYYKNKFVIILEQNVKLFLKHVKTCEE